MSGKSSVQNLYVTDDQARDRAAQLARVVVEWMRGRTGWDRELAISRTAEMFHLDGAALRNLYRRPQDLKKVSYATLNNLMAADRFIQEMRGQIERAQVSIERRTTELVREHSRRPERELVS